jgi:predicted Zn-ribbon and HTH transcriptional regulator
MHARSLTRPHFVRKLPNHPAYWGLPRCRSCGAQFRPSSTTQLRCSRCTAHEVRQ